MEYTSSLGCSWLGVVEGWRNVQYDSALVFENYLESRQKRGQSTGLIHPRKRT